MFQDDVLYSLGMFAVAAWLFKMWLSDTRNFVCTGTPAKGEFPGARPVSIKLAVFGAMCGVVLLAAITAAEIAKTFGIRVYTIGVGTMGKAPYPFQTAFGVQYQNIDVEIDEPTLKQIAATTGGQYFRATDNASLKEIYSEIDQMEKTKISVQQYSKKQEEYKNWAILLFALLLVEIVIRNTLVRNIP